MELLVSKLVVLTLVGIIKFTTGMLPTLIIRIIKVQGKHKKWMEKIIGGVLCFSGGVIMATVLLHILPEVRIIFDLSRKQHASFGLSKNEDHGHSHSDEDHRGHSDEGGHHGHSEEDHHDYPYAELVTCAGFFVIYFVEAVVHRIFIGAHGGSSGSHGHSHAIPPGMLQNERASNKEVRDADNDSGSSDPEKYAISTPNSSTTADSGVDNPAFRIETEGLNNGPINDFKQIENSEKEDDPRTDGNENVNGNNGIRITSTTNINANSEHPDSAVWNKSPFSKKYKTQPPSIKDSTALGGLNGRSNVYNVSSATLTSYTSYNNDGGDHSMDEASLPNHYGLPALDSNTKDKDHSDRERQVLFSVRNFLIVLALSVHSIFEGMAIGLQLTVQDVWKLFLAVSLHDVPVHFCVGMEMFNGGIKKLHIIIYFLILGIITPIGIIIGIVVTEHAGEGGDGTQTLIIGILQGLAGGTLLYITFYEVLDREKLSKAGMTGILGCFLLVCGFAFMAGLEAAGGHSHGVVEKGRIHQPISVQKLFITDPTHQHIHGRRNLEQSLSTLNRKISKYAEHGNQHEINSHNYHTDDNYQSSKETNSYLVEDTDHENEIKEIYSSQNEDIQNIREPNNFQSSINTSHIKTHSSQFLSLQNGRSYPFRIGYS